MQLLIPLRVRPFVAPAFGLAFLSLWLWAVAIHIVPDVQLRTEPTVISPYPVAIAVGFAIAIALSRANIVASLAITGGLLLLQVLFWPTRFSDVTWQAYLGLVLIAIAGGAFTGRRRAWILLVASSTLAVVVGLLLNLPFLSTSGEYGLINGKPVGNAAVIQGTLTWSVVAVGAAWAGWYVGRRIVRPMFDGTPASGAPAVRVDAVPDDALASLSARERDIFLLAAEGRSNRAIAEMASIEESTVKSHLNSISAKLALRSRTELVAMAYRTGLIRPDVEKAPVESTGTVRS